MKKIILISLVVIATHVTLSICTHIVLRKLQQSKIPVLFTPDDFNGYNAPMPVTYLDWFWLKLEKELQLNSQSTRGRYEIESVNAGIRREYYNPYSKKQRTGYTINIYLNKQATINMSHEELMEYIDVIEYDVSYKIKNFQSIMKDNRSVAYSTLIAITEGQYAYILSISGNPFMDIKDSRISEEDYFRMQTQPLKSFFRN